VSKNIAVLPIF
jgi:hypothetical protein